MKSKDADLIAEAYENVLKNLTKKYGFFGTDNPAVGDRVTHEPTGATGIVKGITTQGDMTYVTFKSENDAAHIKKGELVNTSMDYIKVHTEKH